MNKAKQNTAKNYTLLVVSYESADGALADSRAEEDFKNRRFVTKQGLRGKKFFMVELVHPLSREEINTLTQKIQEKKRENLKRQDRFQVLCHKLLSFF